MGTSILTQQDHFSYTTKVFHHVLSMNMFIKMNTFLISTKGSNVLESLAIHTGKRQYLVPALIYIQTI